MDDKFLSQLRELPDAEFANCLYQRLDQNQPRPDPRRGMALLGSTPRARVIRLAAVFVICLLALMAFSPVRAFVANLIIEVAGQSFELSDNYPGDDDPSAEEYTIYPQIMSLDEALAAFPYAVKLPTNIPAVYSLHENSVRVYVGEEAEAFADTIEIEWGRSDNSLITLSISDHQWSEGEIVAPDSLEEIQLDENHAAVLIRGGWDYDHKVWNENIALRLRWSVGDLTYDLMGVDREQLIEIAFSTLE
ncbi:MAG: hypothetical protein JW726_13220 [Anaerolineales bacterium]|nr:hypothetical protein [Anaerolineales bacterium]